MKSGTYNRNYYQFKPRYEKVLGVLFGTLAVFHLIFTMGKYVIGSGYNQTGLKIDRYLALAAVTAAVIYILITVSKYRWHAKGTLGPYIKSAFSGSNLWLTILFIWYLLACVVLSSKRDSAIFRINDHFLLDVFISFFVLYMIPWNRKAYDIFIHILMLVETVFMIWVLYNNFRLNILTVPGGQIGMDDSYSLVIACNRNTTGAYAAVFLMLALYMISVKKGVIRLIYIAAAAIQLFPLYLSNSRTPYFACTAAIAAAAFFLVQRKYNGKHKIILSLGCGLLCGATFYFLKYGVIALYDGITHLSEYLGLSLSDAARDSDVTNTNGRIPIWKASLKAMVLSFESFMIGVTPARVEAILGYIQNKEEYVLYTHNQFLQMGVAFGVPGLAFFCIWLFKTAKQCWKIAFEGKYWMITCMILMLVMSGLMESYLVAYLYFCGSLFFLACGMVKSEMSELSANVHQKPQKAAGKRKKAQGNDRR